VSAGKLDAALKEIERLEKENAADAEALRKKGEIHARKGDLRSALAAFEAALAVDPDLPRGRTATASMKLDLGDVEGAIVDARAAIALDLKDADALLVLGAALLRKSEFDAAVFALESSAALAPDRPLAWTQLGSAYIGRGTKEAAAEAFARALKLDPKNADAKRGLAACGVR
jgi:cellulose synthase operon protein C